MYVYLHVFIQKHVSITKKFALLYEIFCILQLI